MMHHYSIRKVGTSSMLLMMMMMLSSILVLLTVLVPLPVVSGSDTVSVSHQQQIHITNHNTTGNSSNHSTNHSNSNTYDNTYDNRSSILNIPLIHFRIVLDKDVSETILQTTLVQYLTNAMMIDNSNNNNNQNKQETINSDNKTVTRTNKFDTNFISLLGIPALLTYHDFTYQGSLTIHQNAKNTHSNSSTNTTTNNNNTDFRLYHHRLEQQHEEQHQHQHELNDWTMKQVLALQDDISLIHELNVAMMSSMTTIDGSNNNNNNNNDIVNSIDRHNTVVEYFQTIQIQFLESIFPLIQYNNDTINNNNNNSDKKNNRTDTTNSNNNGNNNNTSSTTDTVAASTSTTTLSTTRSTHDKIILILIIAGTIFATAILVQCCSVGMSIGRQRRNKLLQQQLQHHTMFDSTSSTNSHDIDNENGNSNEKENGNGNKQLSPNLTQNGLVKEEDYIIPSTKQYRNRSFWSKILPNRRQYDIVHTTTTTGSTSPTSGSANDTPKSFTSTFFSTYQSKTKSNVTKTSPTTIPYGTTNSPRNVNDHDHNSTNDGDYEDELVSIDQQQQQHQQHFDRKINISDIEKNQFIDKYISINPKNNTVIADNEMNTNNITTTGSTTTMTFPLNTIRSDSPILRSTVLQMMLMVAESTTTIPNNVIDSSSVNNTKPSTNQILLSTPTKEQQQLTTKYDLNNNSNNPRIRMIDAAETTMSTITSSLGTIPEMISFISTPQKNNNNNDNTSSSTTSTSKSRRKHYNNNEIKDVLEEYQRSLTDPINDTSSTTSYTSSMSSMYRTTNNHITTRYRNTTTCNNTSASTSTAGGGGSNSNSNHTNCSVMTNSPRQVNCSNRTMSSISMNIQEDFVSAEDNLLRINDESNNNIINYISSPTTTPTTMTRSRTSMKSTMQLDDTTGMRIALPIVPFNNDSNHGSNNSNIGDDEFLGIDPIIGISTHTVFSNKNSTNNNNANCDNTISSIEMEDEVAEAEQSDSSVDVKDVITGTSRNCSHEIVQDTIVCIDDKKHSSFIQDELVSRDNEFIVDEFIERVTTPYDQIIQPNTDSMNNNTPTLLPQQVHCTVDTTKFVNSDDNRLDHHTKNTKESDKRLEPSIESTEAALRILLTIEKTLNGLSHNINNVDEGCKHNEINDAVPLTESTSIVPTPDTITQLMSALVSESDTLIDNTESTAVDNVSIDGGGNEETDSLILQDTCPGNINDDNIEEQHVHKSNIDIPVLGIQKMVISSFRGPQTLYTSSDVPVNNSIIYETIQNSIIDDENNTEQLLQHFSKYQPSSAHTVFTVEDSPRLYSDEQYPPFQQMVIPYEAHLLPVEEVSDEERDISIDDILYSPSLTSDESNATGSVITNDVGGTEFNAVNSVRGHNNCNTTKEAIEFQTESSVTTVATSTVQSNVSGQVDDTSLTSSSSSNDYHQKGSGVVQVLTSTSYKWQHINHESFQDSKTLSVDIEFIPSCSEHSTSVDDGSDTGRVVVDTSVPRTGVVNEIQPSENKVVEFVIDHIAHSQEKNVMVQEQIPKSQIQTILDTNTSQGVVEFSSQFGSNHTTSTSADTKIRDDSTGDSSETFLDIIACDHGTVKNESIDQSTYSNEAICNTSPKRSFVYQKQRNSLSDYSHRDSDTVLAVKDEEELYKGSGCQLTVLDGEKKVIVSNKENQVNSTQVNSVEAKKRINDILKPLLAKYSIGTIIERVHNDKDGSTTGSRSTHRRSHSYDEHLYGQYSILENKVMETRGHREL